MQMAAPKTPHHVRQTTVDATNRLQRRQICFLPEAAMQSCTSASLVDLSPHAALYDTIARPLFSHRE